MFLVYCNDGDRTYAAKHPSKHYVFPHSRKEWAFQFILKGNCIRLNRENNTTREEPMTGPVVCVSGPDCVHGWTARTNDTCSVLIFHFDEADYSLRHVVDRAGYRCARFSAKDIPKLRALFNRCRQAQRTHDFSSPTIYHIVSLELTLFFLALIPRAELADRTDFGKNKVIEALAWYKANLTHGPSIEEVARASHLSSAHLRRLFHKTQGTSPQESFTRTQFDRAKELMLDQSLSLERIAENSGFGSASAFSRAFKVEFGISPKLYRARLHDEHLASTADTAAGLAVNVR